MTQFQFEIICKALQTGVPALANELCGALNDLVIDRNNLAARVEQLEKENKKKPKIAEVKNDAKTK